MVTIMLKPINRQVQLATSHDNLSIEKFIHRYVTTDEMGWSLQSQNQAAE